ncbi:hypothetical protein C8F01DRAFT_1325224 [Mycena amicta]|nr:hypothetical protein C8F01DRAFT_1325224 [Mycena amicta]
MPVMDTLLASNGIAKPLVARAPRTVAISQVQPEASTLFSSSTSFFTTTSAVSTSISRGGDILYSRGIATSTNVTLVPVATSGSSAAVVTGPIATNGASSNSSTSPPSTGGHCVHRRQVGVLVAVALIAYIRWRRGTRARARGRDSPETGINPFLDRVISDSPHDWNRWRPSSWASFVHSEPAVPVDLDRSNTITTRQMYILNQVHRAREKVAELEESLSLRLSTAESRSMTASTLLPIGGSLPLSDQEQDVTARVEADSEDRLADAFRQIALLNARIEEMELQRRSSWALGLTDVPPPGYYDIA